ncbi:cytochrome c biogenesis protein ResB [Humibacter ginsenosidimutans]|uniref:Cytochrome c biogenesis protein ResB n=2 Tax=Humibacter ginsenosidimutans TaxID=2599293 RepID=A0A5B8M9V3_9MICO|nr:cytochrome c biogenesis protein ResB [Humibacter ginsenosidimutans]
MWRQLTSMRTALFLLLLLAVAAVPGSLVPQHTSDPNGVVQYQENHPVLYPILDKLQVFDTYTSVWFSAIYLLLFVSLVGCVVPRLKHHLEALRAKPPRTPARLARMAGYRVRVLQGMTSQGASAEAEAARQAAIVSAQKLLKASGYRTVVLETARDASVSAERGYLRETGNILFHAALVGILIAVGVGGGLSYTGQRIVVDGQSFVNTLVNYDSINPGRFVDTSGLSPFAIKLDQLDVKYESKNKNAMGSPLDYTAYVTTTENGTTSKKTIKVNEPLGIGGTNVYLLGNGYAPIITVRNAKGKAVFHDAVPFPSQDTNMTSQGIVKVPDGLKEQLGMIGFFYPTAQKLSTGAYTSSYPDTRDPMLGLSVYQGDLGLDKGLPVSVYALNIDKLKEIAGPGAKAKAIDLKPGESASLPNGLGTVTFDGVARFVSLEVHHDPTQGWMLLFAVLVLGGLLTSLFVPRRRLWVKAITQADGSLRLEYAGLARGEDPRLDDAVASFADRHIASLTGRSRE